MRSSAADAFSSDVFNYPMNRRDSLRFDSQRPAFLMLKGTELRKNRNDASSIRKRQFNSHRLFLSSAAVSEQQKEQETLILDDGPYLDEKQLDFACGYLNSKHPEVIRLFALAYTELGIISKKKNAFSGGSYVIESATLTNIDQNQLYLDATVQIRGEKEPVTEHVTVDLDADPVEGFGRKYPTLPKVNFHPIRDKNKVDHFVRRFNRLANIVKQYDVTGKLVQMSFQLGGNSRGYLKENMFLNQVPHNRYVRQYFYDLAANATLCAIQDCSDGRITNRMKMTALFPELNPSMDAYRIGTLLELARTIAIRVAEQNLRIRICVQGSMGVGIFTGTPKQLNGVATLLQRMDWQSDEGEENEGMVGNYVNFGAIGAEHVVNSHVDKDGNQIEQDDVFLLICPQSMVGLESSIIQPLQEMVNAAGDRPVIILNPDLTDKVSSQGQQSVRGRQQRIDFANSFKSIFHFQCLYISGTSYFPILGATSHMSPSEPWIAYQRRDLSNDGGELYVPVVSSETQPTGEVIISSFET